MKMAQEGAGSVVSMSMNQAVDPPTLFSPLSEPKLNARPCDRLRILTNPVIGASSPAFSMLRFAKASSPVDVS